MFLLAFGIGFEGVQMMIGGPLLFAMDVGYRKLRKRPGAIMLYVPGWVWGVFWTVLGAVYHFAG